MANSVTARFNDDCKVHVAMSDDTTVTKAVIIDAEGNETDIGGGGGESDFSTAEVTMKLPADLSAATLDIQLTDPLTENSNGVVVIEENNIRYITTDAQTVELAKPSLTEETRVVYLYKNNPVYIKWPLAQSTADYTITGAGEAVGINIDDNTIYAVKVTGNCAIILNAHE